MSRIAILFLFVAACSNDSTPADLGVDAAGDVTVDAATTRSAACVQLDTDVMAALSNVQASSTSSTLATSIDVPACGTKTYVVTTDTPAVPADQRTYRIGSITKTFVSSALLELAAAGKVDLDALVSSVLPALPGITGVTIRQLLNHSSGIFNYTDDTATFQATQAADPKHKYAPADLVQIASTHAAYFAPGTGWTYSNTNYIIAGMLVEKLSGQSAAAYIRATFLVPQSLMGTYLEGGEAAIGTLAPGADNLGIDVTNTYDPSWAWTAGAMIGQLDDITTWTKLRGNGSIHSAATQMQLVTGVATTDPSLTYGLGLFILSPSITGGLGQGLGHDGDLPGYHTQTYYFPARKATITSVVTSDSASVNDITAAMLPIVSEITK